MKILAASDIHDDFLTVKKLAKKAEKEKVDLVLLAGDLTISGEVNDSLLKPFRDKDKKVLLVPGNHETIATGDFLAEIFGMKNIHGYSVRYEDIGFFGCGGADFGLTALTEKEIFENLKKGFDRIKYLEKRIMLTHMHPSKSKSEFSGFKGSKAVRKAIEQFKPSILIHGHIHEAEGIEERVGKTRVINVGKEGKIIQI